MAPKNPQPPVITLLTDFGLQDAYVGVMKGVILSLNPEVHLVDLSHEVKPLDILSGALILQSAWRYFPPGTIHLAVVDPGVGSRRRPMAAACDEQFLVGPDNGLFSLVMAEPKSLTMVCLENSRYFLPEVSATFHGRDIFAPVAAHLSRGVALTSLGPTFHDPVRLDLAAPEFGAAEVTGQIISSDHFGNLISNIPFEALQAWLRGRSASLRVKGRVIQGPASTYSDVPPGTLLALGSSHGYLEIACRQGNAAQVLGAAVGDRVEVYLT